MTKAETLREALAKLDEACNVVMDLLTVHDAANEEIEGCIDNLQFAITDYQQTKGWI